MNILITGGSSGLGRAIVERLASDTTNSVFFTYKSHQEVAESIAKKYNNVQQIQCDFSDEDSLGKFIASLTDKNINVLIHNAYFGNPQSDHFHKIPQSDFLSSFKVNVLPVIAITQKVLLEMKKNKDGRIITILSSSIVNVPPAGYSLYSSNKAYIWQLAKSWSKEYIRFGISSNCVSPNFMMTELTKGTDSRIIEQMIHDHPLKRILTPDEVAECVYFLTRASKQINGVNIPINVGENIL
jgi:NAD(P)-dependent dehydrogenase (short-subunit alcohol dehydrogenase family)